MRLPSIGLNRETLSRFEDAIQKEWLVTNGLGGYASSTVLGINTRKYHGLLVAALHPPKDRRVFLTKLDEDVTIGKEVYRLGANEFQEGFFPRGYSYLEEFSVSPFPKYVYALPNVEVQKTIFMPYGKNALITLYSILNSRSFDVKVQVFPIVNGRHFHSVTDRSQSQADFVQKQDGAGVEMSLKPTPASLMMNSTEGRYFARGKWVERMYLREEAHRGESCFDDCYQPGYFEASVKAGEGKDFAMVAVAGEVEDSAREVLAQLPSTTAEANALYEDELCRCESLLMGFYGTHRTLASNSWLDWLVLATDTFVVQGGAAYQKSVIAGYHWFEAWGRDTFISLPGLVLVPGRFEYARRVFLSFKDYFKQGLMPNFLPDGTEQPVYNTVDATLWFVNAVLQYLKYTGDFKFVREQLWETLKSIVENHVKGTAFDIRVDEDCLLSHGPQLTWMDATFDGKPVTPRAGKAVEVQALWYNTLRTVQLLAEKFNKRNEAETCAQIAEKTRKSFAEKFWNARTGCLYDVVGEQESDDSLRPNQILAAALDFSLLDVARNQKVVDLVQRELLTPYGLRTLGRDDSRYVGVYAGDRRCRDNAYHNGTVWPWLLGPFVTAFLKTRGYVESGREYALKYFLTPLFAEKVFERGLGTLSEVFDGDPPHASRGCISQAWSVAEPLRAYVEDVMQVRPRCETEVLQGLG
ncbi:MAG TPA: amylo-alpha-1,6-glucosidase [candidate division Zixibacteria bacterium]|nr:amylo-alpha-1,6-glucosidase [candidate division Zixibacteria bacterium]